MSAVNSGFFQVLGIGGLIVAFLCAFFLKEPKDSFAEHHQGDSEDTVAPEVNLEPERI